MERSWHGLAGAVAVDVRSVETVREGRDIERHLDVAEGDQDLAGDDTLARGIENPAAAAEHVEQDRDPTGEPQ